MNIALHPQRRRSRLFRCFCVCQRAVDPGFSAADAVSLAVNWLKITANSQQRSSAGGIVHSKVRLDPALLHLDQFDRLAAWAFDHDGAGVAEWIGFFEEFHSLAAQFFDPR